MEDNQEHRRPYGVGAAARSGVLYALAASIFIAPFGALAGVVAAEGGWSLGQAVGLSVIVFAGASQLAAMELMRVGAPWPIIVISALAVNLRFLLYSATLTPIFQKLSRGGRLAIAMASVDNSVSGLLSWRRFDQASLEERFAYYVGCGATCWVVWQAFTVIGHQLGPLLDPKMLTFVAPVAFTALAAPLLTTRPRWAAAIVAVAAAVLLKGRFFHLDLIAAVLLGVGAATLLFKPPAAAEPPADEIMGPGE